MIVTTLAAVTAPGDHLARRWTVYTSWRAHRSIPATETCQSFHDWNAARRHALQTACLAGARYVTVQTPEDVVMGSWDSYTNRWREYMSPGTGEF